MDEEHRENIIKALEIMIDNVKSAVVLEGTVNMERPSLSPACDGVRPIGFVGENHIRYTVNIDVLLPHQSLPETVIKEGV